jgi:hypothetical protein
VSDDARSSQRRGRRANVILSAAVLGAAKDLELL